MDYCVFQLVNQCFLLCIVVRLSVVSNGPFSEVMSRHVNSRTGGEPQLPFVHMITKINSMEIRVFRKEQIPSSGITL